MKEKKQEDKGKTSIDTNKELEVRLMCKMSINIHSIAFY